jgi:cytochrome c biogenesis DsbD-like protein
MSYFITIASSLVLLASSFQGLAPKPSAIQHVTIAATADPNPAAPRGKVVLALDVTPDPKVHVYAPGAKDYVQTTLTITAPARTTAGKPTYPPSELIFDTALNQRIPQYVKTFRIVQPITLGSALKAGERVEVAGLLTYQACDDRMCFPPTSAAVSWTVNVR